MKKQKTSDPELAYHFANKSKNTSKTGHQAYQMPMYHVKDAAGLTHNLPSSSAGTLNNSSVAEFVETINDHINQRNGRIREDGKRSTTQVNYTQLDQINSEPFQRSAKEFIDLIFLGGKYNSTDGISSESEFTDHLDNLNPDRSLFLQSLQSPQRDRKTMKRFLDPRVSECGTRGSVDSEMLEYGVRNNKRNDVNLLKKTVKYQQAYSSNRSSSPQTSNRIVVLRPGQNVTESPLHVTCTCSSLQSHHQRFKNKGQNFKPTYFFLKEIKRRLKRALGENQDKRQWITSFYRFPSKKQITTGTGDQGIRADFSSRNPAGSSTDTKRNNKLEKRRAFIPRNGPEISSTDATVCRKLKSSTGSYSRHHQSDIFQEAKKHLSDRLRNVNKREILEKGQAPRTLARILNSPEHDLFSPSSNRGREHGVSTATGFSTYKLLIKDDQKHNGDSKISGTNDLRRTENLFTFEVPSETTGNNITSARHSPQREELWKEYNLTMLASTSQDQVGRSSFEVSSSSLSIYSPEEVYSIKDGEEHQSPISVLEPLFMEDASSPNSILTDPDKGSLQPHRIDFERVLDPKIDTSSCINEEESISVYVREVLQASGLDWNEPLLTRPSPGRILDTALSHGDRLFSTELDHDPELLFDCVNDVLIDVYRQNFGCSPWTSYLKPKIRSFQPENDLVDEVVKGVKCLLNPQVLQPTLNQLVGQDFTKSSSWIDIRSDAEDLVNEIAEDVLVESVLDTILVLHI